MARHTTLMPTQFEPWIGSDRLTPTFRSDVTILLTRGLSMDVTVGRTLFILDLDTLEVTICTWEGEEARLPVMHLCSLLDHLRTKGVALPLGPPAILGAHDTDNEKLRGAE